VSCNEETGKPLSYRVKANIGSRADIAAPFEEVAWSYKEFTRPCGPNRWRNGSMGGVPLKGGSWRMVVTHALTVDEQIQRDVLEALYRDPDVPAARIGVEVENGFVTLTGTVETLEEGLGAECATFEVDGVRSITNDIELHPASARNDAEMLRAVTAALASDVPQHDGIKISVCNGRVLLEGTVDQEYQKRIAELVVHRVTGVHTVANFIEVEHPENPVAWTAPTHSVIENGIGTIP
jgi:osmotically-inducible protein OsmY